MLDWQYLNDYCDIDFVFGNHALQKKRDTIPDLELMQYVSISDINKRDIYEGDIVRVVADENEFIYIVIFDMQELDFKVTNGKENYGKNYKYLSCCEEIEVLGNTFENPELVEKIGQVT